MKIRPEILQAVQRLEIKSRRSLSALLAGNYRSAFRGSGMQFKEFRPYEEGDDIRHMSWQVTARTGRPTLKLFEEERELNIILAVDVSGSSLLGVCHKRKIDVYAEIVALLGLAAVRSEDNVGMLLFDCKATQYLPPRRTRDYVLNAVTRVLACDLESKKSDLSPPLIYLRHILKARSIVIVMSDFMSPPFEDALRLLSEKHEVILLHCYDDREKGFGKEEGVLEIRDPENGEYLLLDTGSAASRRAMANSFSLRSQELETMATGVRSDYLRLSLEDDYVQRLVHFFRERGSSRL